MVSIQGHRGSRCCNHTSHPGQCHLLGSVKASASSLLACLPQSPSFLFLTVSSVESHTPKAPFHISHCAWGTCLVLPSPSQDGSDPSNALLPQLMGGFVSHTIHSHLPSNTASAAGAPGPVILHSLLCLLHSFGEDALGLCSGVGGEGGRRGGGRGGQEEEGRRGRVAPGSQQTEVQLLAASLCASCCRVVFGK